jgi:hypothetical protein
MPTTEEGIEVRENRKGEKYLFNKKLGGIVLTGPDGPDPERVAGGIQAAKTRKKNEKAAEKDAGAVSDGE